MEWRQKQRRGGRAAKGGAQRAQPWRQRAQSDDLFAAREAEAETGWLAGWLADSLTGWPAGWSRADLHSSRSERPTQKSNWQPFQPAATGKQKARATPLSLLLARSLPRSGAARLGAPPLVVVRANLRNFAPTRQLFGPAPLREQRPSFSLALLAPPPLQIEFLEPGEPKALAGRASQLACSRALCSAELPFFIWPPNSTPQLIPCKTDKRTNAHWPRLRAGDLGQKWPFNLRTPNEMLQISNRFLGLASLCPPARQLRAV